MSLNDLAIKEAKSILVSYIKDNLKDSKNKHCNNHNWQFAIKHSFRVEDYANRIMSTMSNLGEEQRLTTSVAAILHDIGNVVQRENHGIIGSKIIRELFNNTEFISKSCVNIERLCRIIADHSNKENLEDNDICSLILKDADILDQIGAMSILSIGCKRNYSSYEFYKEIISDIKEKELSFCKRQYALLKTEEGHNIMNEKITFIENFKKQLEEEIKGEINNKDIFN